MDFSKIRTLDEIEAAQRALSAELSERLRKVGSDTESLRSAFSAGSLLSAGLRSASRAVSYPRIALMLLRLLRTRLARRR